MNCYNFQRIISFMASQANSGPNASRHSAGVQFLFAADKLTLRAIRPGVTTTLELVGEEFSGNAAFFVPFNDLYELKAPLSRELDKGGQADAVITYVGKNVLIQISDWWEFDCGVKLANPPKRCNGGQRGKVRLEDIAEAAHSLYKVSCSKHYKHEVSNGGHSAIIEIAEPAFGIHKVTQEVF